MSAYKVEQGCVYQRSHRAEGLRLYRLFGVDDVNLLLSMQFEWVKC